MHTRVQHAEFRSRIHAETSVKDAESRQPVGPRPIGGLLKLPANPPHQQPSLHEKGRGGASRATLIPGLINRWNFLSFSLPFFFIFMNIVLRRKRGKERKKGIHSFLIERRKFLTFGKLKGGKDIYIKVDF